MKINPLISVVIPVYNRSQSIVKAIQSAFSTAYDPLEVIVVDDGSTDNTLSKVQELAQADRRIRIVRHPNGKNCGPGKSRNLGGKVSKGTLLAFLDSDDWYLPNRFDSAVSLLQSNANFDVVCGGTIRVVGPGGAARARLVREISWLDCDNPEEVLAGRLAGRLAWSTNSILVRRRVFLESGGFSERRDIPEDAVLWLKLASKYRIASSGPHPVSVYNIHGGNMSTKAALYPTAAVNTSVILEAILWARSSKVDDSRIRELYAGLQGKLFFECSRLRESGKPRVAFAALLHSVRVVPRLAVCKRFWANVLLAANDSVRSGVSGS